MSNSLKQLCVPYMTCSVGSNIIWGATGITKITQQVVPKQRWWLPQCCQVPFYNAFLHYFWLCCISCCFSLFWSFAFAIDLFRIKLQLLFDLWLVVSTLYHLWIDQYRHGHHNIPKPTINIEATNEQTKREATQPTAYNVSIAMANIREGTSNFSRGWAVAI